MHFLNHIYWHLRKLLSLYRDYILYFRNWPLVFLLLQGIVTTRNGLSFFYRDSNDLKIILGVAARDDYQLSTLADIKKIVDAGAHIGTFACLASKTFPNAQIISIEPEAHNYEMLLMNLKLNHCTNVTPLNKALYPTHTSVSIQRGPTSSSHSVREGNDIETVTLSDFDPIDLLKVDIEGIADQVLPHPARVTLLDAKGENPALIINATPLGHKIYRL